MVLPLFLNPWVIGITLTTISAVVKGYKQGRTPMNTLTDTQKVDAYKNIALVGAIGVSTIALTIALNARK